MGGYLTSAVLAFVLAVISFMYSDCQADKHILKDKTITELQIENKLLQNRLQTDKDSIRKEIIKELSDE